MGLFCHCDCHVAALDRVLQTFSRGLILAAERRHFPRRKAKISKSRPVCSQGPAGRIRDHKWDGLSPTDQKKRPDVPA